MIITGFRTVNKILIASSFLSLQLLDIVYREETLLNVIRAVTTNGRSILLTAVLAVILIYLFSIVGFIFFKDDFLIEADKIAAGDGGKMNVRLSGDCDMAVDIFSNSFLICLWRITKPSTI